MNIDINDIKKTTNLLDKDAQEDSEGNDINEIEMLTKVKGRKNKKDMGFAFKFNTPPKPDNRPVKKKENNTPEELRDYHKYFKPPWYATILAKAQTFIFPFISGMMTGLGMITAALIVSRAKGWILQGWPISNNTLEGEDEDYYGTGVEFGTPYHVPNRVSENIRGGMSWTENTD